MDTSPRDYVRAVEDTGWIPEIDGWYRLPSRQVSGVFVRGVYDEPFVSLISEY